MGGRTYTIIMAWVLAMHTAAAAEEEKTPSCSDGDTECLATLTEESMRLKVHLLQQKKGAISSTLTKSTGIQPDVIGAEGTGEGEEAERAGFEPKSKFYELTEDQISMVPKNLQPLDQTALRALNVQTVNQTSLIAFNATDDSAQTSTHTPVYPYGVYCGSSTRFDVAGFMGQSLSVQGCYVFSCVEPFVVSSTCGPYFYTNGDGNCKCCDYGSNFYLSSANPPNYLYSCNR